MEIVAETQQPPTLAILHPGTGLDAGHLVASATFALPGEITALHVDGDANGDGIADPVITSIDGIALLMSIPTVAPARPDPSTTYPAAHSMSRRSISESVLDRRASSRLPRRRPAEHQQLKLTVDPKSVAR